MGCYKAPLNDIDFICDVLLGSDAHYAQLFGEDTVTGELRHAIFEEAAKFSEQVLAPLYRQGDEQGCRLTPEGVVTPEGFAAAYRQYVEGGWPGLSMPEAFGGQALPKSMELLVGEMFGQANHAWAMYPGLSAGCRATLLAHGADKMQQIYLPPLVSGEWTGTMCLTEPQCGSDLSFLRTKAEPQSDDSYKVTGTKIFISSGDHDMAENIVHLVLARLPDAPAGTRGISLFLVPKYLVDEQRNIGARNSVSCGSLEHKMGIHGNATCVMNFDGAKGYLIGEAHKGLKCMFTFMNSARLGVALEGLNHSEVALQGALAYALDREAGRSLTGVKAPDRPADRLIVHPDVRRMVLTIRALTEGNRAFAHYLGQLVDKELYGTDEQRREANQLLAFFTPIAKGFMTECAVECANLGMQVYGGHGYIAEWGMEQNLRDARITTLYEGTTGIQALDLIARKVVQDGGANLATIHDLIRSDLSTMGAEFSDPIENLLVEWKALAEHVLKQTGTNLDNLGAAAVDHLMYAGYVMQAWFWGRMGSLALEKNNQESSAFYRTKLATARFFFARILPRTTMHKVLIEAGSDTLMALSDADFDAVRLG